MFCDCSRHIIQNRQSAFSLASHEWLFMQRQRMEDLLLWARVFVTILNAKILRRRLADYTKKMRQKACCTCSTILFLPLTNQIIDLWRRCRRHFLKRTLRNRMTKKCRARSGMHNLARHLFVILSSCVFQQFCRALNFLMTTATRKSFQMH